MSEEEKYESIELIVRCREDGQSWFDIIFHLISGDCEENPTGGCTCGLESMGGSTGTLDQCYDHQFASPRWAVVKTEDLKLALHRLAADEGMDDEAYERLRKEAYWHDDFDEWLANLPEEEEDCYNCGANHDCALCDPEYYLDKEDEEDGT